MQQYNEQQKQRAETASNDEVLGEELQINLYLHQKSYFSLKSFRWKLALLIAEMSLRHK